MAEKDAPGPYEMCHLVNMTVTARDGTKRWAQGGWTHARCLECAATLWIPPGGAYTLTDVCKWKAAN